MKRFPRISLGSFMAALAGAAVAATVTSVEVPAPPVEVYKITSPYHNIRVADQAGLRTLFFDDTMESRMDIKNPVMGQFEYTEYFQMPYLWNANITSILILGLGGGSTQKTYAFYHPEVVVETFEIDPRVAEVAQKYFEYKLGDKQKLTVADGRQALVRNTKKYDAILMDAYTQGRYGASIPPHLVTKEFFEIARDHLAPNGVLAYNVIATLRTYNADIVSAVYRTLRQVFPNVYIFRAKTTLNVIVVATMSKTPMDQAAMRQTAKALVDSKKMTFPNFLDRVDSFSPGAPIDFEKAPILTDDFAPVEGLTGAGAGLGK